MKLVHFEHNPLQRNGLNAASHSCAAFASVEHGHHVPALSGRSSDLEIHVSRKYGNMAE
jgi:hypothetical protein